MYQQCTNRLVQCTNCSLWVHVSCSDLSPTDFRKISTWTCPMCPSSSLTSPSQIITPYLHPQTPSNPHLYLQISTNPHLQKPPPTINNLTDLPNHPQLTFAYPTSASSLPPTQPQHTISPLTQSSFHPSSPSQNNLRILQ